MEWWSDGKLISGLNKPTFPVFQYSNTPTLQYSNALTLDIIQRPIIV